MLLKKELKILVLILKWMIWSLIWAKWWKSTSLSLDKEITYLIGSNKWSLILKLWRKQDTGLIRSGKWANGFEAKERRSPIWFESNMRTKAYGELKGYFLYWVKQMNEIIWTHSIGAKRQDSCVICVTWQSYAFYLNWVQTDATKLNILISNFMLKSKRVS